MKKLIILEKNLKSKFNYDTANDYELTVSGNYSEVINAVFALNMEKVLRTKKAVNLLFGEEGVLEDMPAGHVMGYLSKSKSFAKTFKKTTVAHEYGGEWIIGGTYAVPMDILCNDVTLGVLYANRNKLKSGVILPYFGKLELGHFAGGTLTDGVWYKPNGEAHPTHGAKNVIMIAFYNATVEEVLAKDFDPTTIIEDVYAGQIMSYYRCGEFKYTVDPEGSELYCEDETHADDKGAYHLHDLDTTKYTVVEDGEFDYCDDEYHVDDKFAYHTHFECDFENEEGHDHASMGEGWYYKEGEEYKKVGAIENAVANLTLKDLMGGRFSMAETLRGVKLGEAMNLVRCDESGEDCPVLEVDPTHTCNEGWYEKMTEGGVVTYKKVTLVLEKIADIDLYQLFTNGISLDETFSGVYVGDVLGYAHCYIDENGNRVCSEELGHGDGDHKTNDMWYIHTDTNDDGVVDETDGYRKATALERTMSGVLMTKILNGEFDVEKELEEITLGEFMGHEKCTGDEDCFIHADPADCTHNKDCTQDSGCPIHLDDCLDEGDVVWYDEDDYGNYVQITDNLTLAIADFTIKQMQDPTFADQLLDRVENRVTIGDIFDSTEGTPLSLLDPDTTIGGINEELVDVFKTATAGEMYKANVLPFDDATFKKMDEVFGGLIMLDIGYSDTLGEGVVVDRINNDTVVDDRGTPYDESDDITYGDLMQAALDANASLKVSIPVLGSVDYAEQKAAYDAYVSAVGETFWMSLTATQLVDVLINAVNL